MLGGLLGRSGSDGVEHLLELDVPGSTDRLFFSLHASGQIRLWELTTRRLLHTGTLLGPGVVEAYRPTIARLSS